MSTVFSEYVRSLKAGHEPLDQQRFEALLTTLRQALIYEMKVRSLWTVSPSFLGVQGHNWSDEGSLEDLLLDCYQFIFIRRLQGLMSQAEMRSNIDGLVFLNIRHFLHDTQKRYDPLGYRVFEVAHGAVADLVGKGDLHVLAGDGRIRNDTVLGFSPWTDPLVADQLELGPVVTPWNNDLMPDLLVAWAKEDVQQRLAKRLSQLPAAEIEAFRFLDLITPLKEDARGRWQAVQRVSQGELAFEDGGDDLLALVRMTQPELEYEDRQSFEALLACMEKSLDKRQDRQKTRSYLNRLWLYIRSWAQEQPSHDPGGPTTTGSAAVDVPVDTGFIGGSFPSHKKLGELLGMPRGRIPELLAILGGMVDACSATDLGQSTVKRSIRGGISTPSTSGVGAVSEGRDRFTMDQERRESLRQRTSALAAELADRRRALQRQEGPRPGDVFLLPATRALAVEWLVVEHRPEDRLVAVLPMDDHPLVGGNDIELGKPAAPRHLRCGFAPVWLDSSLCQPPWLSDHLQPAVLEKVKEQRAVIAAPGQSSAVDDDPEYQAWSSLLELAIAALPKAPILPFVRTASTSSPPDRGRPRGYALAAALALATIGASLWGLRQQQRLDAHLDEPILVEGSSRLGSIDFGETQRGIGTLRTRVEETHIWLYLVMRNVEPLPSYRFRLVAEPGQHMVWESRDRNAADEYLLALPRRLLDDNLSYVLQLYGRKGERLERLDEQRLHITFDPETEPFRP